MATDPDHRDALGSSLGDVVKTALLVDEKAVGGDVHYACSRAQQIPDGAFGIFAGANLTLHRPVLAGEEGVELAGLLVRARKGRVHLEICEQDGVVASSGDYALSIAVDDQVAEHRGSNGQWATCVFATEQLPRELSGVSVEIKLQGGAGPKPMADGVRQRPLPQDPSDRACILGLARGDPVVIDQPKGFWNPETTGMVYIGPVVALPAKPETRGPSRLDGWDRGWQEYFPYGKASDRRDERSRYRYIGVERDELTKLSMTGPRTYDPLCGRFSQADPLVSTRSPFGYSFCRPTRQVDKTGYWPSDPTETSQSDFRELETTFADEFQAPPPEQDTLGNPPSGRRGFTEAEAQRFIQAYDELYGGLTDPSHPDYVLGCNAVCKLNAMVLTGLSKDDLSASTRVHDTAEILDESGWLVDGQPTQIAHTTPSGPGGTLVPNERFGQGARKGPDVPTGWEVSPASEFVDRTPTGTYGFFLLGFANGSHSGFAIVDNTNSDAPTYYLFDQGVWGHGVVLTAAEFDEQMLAAQRGARRVTLEKDGNPERKSNWDATLHYWQIQVPPDE